MMIEFENRIEINRPIEEVFRFLADLENLAKWNYFVTRVQKTSPGPPAVGANYHQERKTDIQELRIVELEMDRLLTLETVPPSKPELRRSMTFEEINGKTRIIDRWSLESDYPSLLQPLARRKVKSAVHDNLLKLKELLEKGRVTLQDGRQTSL
jgi:uncharacterized membrane protein